MELVGHVSAIVGLLFEFGWLINHPITHYTFIVTLIDF